jgi:branched-subunit amino acid aminotransferase/4-amino-4-deoxychorismate lyase
MQNCLRKVTSSLTHEPWYCITRRRGEGLSSADGKTALFRPEANIHRFQNPAKRLAMAQLLEDLFLETVRMLVADQAWIPAAEGSAL